MLRLGGGGSGGGAGGGLLLLLRTRVRGGIGGQRWLEGLMERMVFNREFLIRSFSKKVQLPAKNEEIIGRVPKVIFVDETNTKRGIYITSELLSQVDRKRFDLVLVNPEHVPPIAKLVARSAAFQKQQAHEEAAARGRLKLREKEVKFGTSIALNDRNLRISKVQELLEKAYRVKLVIESRGVKGRDPIAKETFNRSLMEDLKSKFGKDLVVLTPPESLDGDLVTLIHSASAKPPSTKPRHGNDSSDRGGDANEEGV